MSWNECWLVIVNWCRKTMANYVCSNVGWIVEFSADILPCLLSCFNTIYNFDGHFKGGLVEKKCLHIILRIQENLNFLFLSLCVYPFKSCSSQFFCHWESGKPAFCREELIFPPFKNQNKSLIFRSECENSNFAVS